jgi:DNA-binding HxlR family transcriptional regulator
MSRSYAQYCPLARALDVVGDRWAMLVVRELSFSPKRFTDLEQRLDGIAPNLLSRRLKELEAAGVVDRRRLDPPAAATVYELTEKGRGLETAMFELAKWGIGFLGAFEGGEAFNLEWLIPALEEMADRDAARGVWEVYEFRIDDASFWVRVEDGDVTVRAFLGIGFGTIVPEDAAAGGRTRITGDAAKAEKALDILAPVRRIFSRA